MKHEYTALGQCSTSLDCRVLAGKDSYDTVCVGELCYCRYWKQGSDCNSFTAATWTMIIAQYCSALIGFIIFIYGSVPLVKLIYYRALSFKQSEVSCMLACMAAFSLGLGDLYFASEMIILGKGRSLSDISVQAHSFLGVLVLGGLCAFMSLVSLAITWMGLAKRSKTGLVKLSDRFVKKIKIILYAVSLMLLATVGGFAFFIETEKAFVTLSIGLLGVVSLLIYGSSALYFLFREPDARSCKAPRFLIAMLRKSHSSNPQTELFQNSSPSVDVRDFTNRVLSCTFYISLVFILNVLSTSAYVYITAVGKHVHIEYTILWYVAGVTVHITGCLFALAVLWFFRASYTVKLTIARTMAARSLTEGDSFFFKSEMIQSIMADNLSNASL